MQDKLVVYFHFSSIFSKKLFFFVMKAFTQQQNVFNGMNTLAVTKMAGIVSSRKNNTVEKVTPPRNADLSVETQALPTLGCKRGRGHCAFVVTNLRMI